MPRETTRYTTETKTDRKKNEDVKIRATNTAHTVISQVVEKRIHPMRPPERARTLAYNESYLVS